jgi:RNA polymerase sigma-70 factor (ECF subfamily)
VVHRRARTLLGTDEEARDAMQEVFVRILGAQHEFRGEAPILHWIYRITTRVCLDRLRKRRTHPVVEDPEAVAQILAAPEALVDRRAILQVLSRTDAQTQEIAVHYYLDGLKMEEVADLVGLSRKTVGKKLETFRKRAAAWLGGKG